MELADHLLYSGDPVPARNAMPTVVSMLEAYARVISNGLMRTPLDPRYWNFYDWADGLAGVIGGTDPSLPQSDRLDAPLNLFYCLALRSAAKLADACGSPDRANEYHSRADAVANLFHDAFWDPDEGVYLTYTGPGAPKHYAELVQSLAILAGACPSDVERALRDRLTSHESDLVETTLSQSLYKFEALLGDSDRYGAWVFDKIARDWGHMLMSGATSFWETMKAGSDFDNAGSLCHGWSGIPVYFYAAYLLGVRPLDAGFKLFTVAPITSVVAGASGRIPTPYGIIELEWEKLGGEVKYHLVHPRGTTPVMMNYE
jgi:hypothetical protein